jgi:photosystem II stability/assembly factor-like uncharacterized protein
VLLAVATHGGIYTSTDSGNTWLSNTVPADASTSWGAAAVSADGITLIAGAVGSGPVCYSTNQGATWSTNGVPTGSWYSVVCTADGSKLAATWGGGHVVYVSTNSGATWTNNNTVNGFVLACSADGSHLMLGFSDLYVSTNWGATFTDNGNVFAAGAWPLAASADASRVVALPSIGLLLSTNLGLSWKGSYAPTNHWKGMALSADGTKLVAAADGSSGCIFAWRPPVLNETNAGGNLQLSWSTNGTSFGLQLNSDPTTTNWLPVTNKPTVTNSQNQVTLPQTNDAGFFRLISQ